MHTVIRHYTNATSLFDDLITRENDVRPLLEAVPGFIRYGLFRTSDGGFSETSSAWTMLPSRRSPAALSAPAAHPSGSSPALWRASTAGWQMSPLGARSRNHRHRPPPACRPSGACNERTR